MAGMLNLSDGPMRHCIRRLHRPIVVGAVLILLASALPDGAWAQGAPGPAAATAPDSTTLGPLPSVDLVQGDEDFALPIQLLLLLTVLSVAPAIILMMTSFTRIVVVFSILRQALGLRQSPPSQLIIGLSMFLTVFIMYPVIDQVNDDALQPYMQGEITQKTALDNALRPTKRFMLNQTRDKDLMLFMDMANIPAFDSAEEVPLHVLVPAFVISELRIAFQIGFMLFLPFLIVDIIVASVLMSMGMMMLPPIMISLPLKLLLFVLTDGWYLIVESVVRGYVGA
jgi:flagellar biosynthetic protein FliP